MICKAGVLAFVAVTALAAPNQALKDADMIKSLLHRNPSALSRRLSEPAPGVDCDSMLWGEYLFGRGTVTGLDECVAHFAAMGSTDCTRLPGPQQFFQALDGSSMIIENMSDPDGTTCAEVAAGAQKVIDMCKHADGTVNGDGYAGVNQEVGILLGGSGQ